MKPRKTGQPVLNFGNNRETKENGMCRALKAVAVFCACIAWLTTGQQGLAQTSATPDPCNNVASIGLDTFCDAAATQQITGQLVVPGQTIYYRASLTRALNECCVTGGVVNVTTPDGVVHFAGAVGNQLICNPGNAVPGSSPGTNFPVIAYTVREVDMGRQTGFFPCGFEPANSVQALVTYTGGVNFCNGTCAANAATDNCNPVRTLGLVVEKAVACTTGTVCDASLSYGSSASGAAFGGNNPEFCYRFIFRNTGTAGLNVTSVVDSVLGPLTPPGGLAPGQAVTNFSGVTTVASPTVNTVTARAAQTVTSCYQTSLVAQASATATPVPSTISCEVRFIQGGQLLTGNAGCGTACDPPASIVINPGGGPVSVVVRVTNNAGNGQNIVNGVVTVGGSNFNVPGPIAPGSFADVTVDTVNGDTIGCHAYIADVTFQGATTGNCPPITTTCNNKFEICGEPCVHITKLVKCLEVDECLAGLCSTDLSEYAPSATGVRDAGFCYSITVSNCGTLVLTNVVVTDNQLGGALGFPTTLNVGQSATRFFEKSYPGVVGTIRNTATVTGQSAGGAVSATTNAVVNLLPASIQCTKQVSIDGGPFTAGGTVEVPFDSLHTLTFRVIVRNNGSVNLQNVQIIDTGVSGCGPLTNIVASLPVGASVTNVLCELTEVSCPPTASITNIVQVKAEVGDQVCSIDPANCQRITTSTSCTNVITLTCTPPGACRTTGGGKQPREDTCPEVRYVTHGGQVGASFGVAGAPDCATDTGFNNPCIRGEYQHVRHIKGGLRGVFHAAGNGRVSQFDSLMCACLPCEFTDTPSPFGGCHPADRTYVGNATSPGKKHDLCNPGDRICGPEPRRAPANKICFSGVGNYTMSNGKKSPQSVVFRVDLEDRSEPGGAHPRGAKAPPDRYRMRMWFIASGTADTAAVKALRATVACKDATEERIPTVLDCLGTATPAPDIDDGGDLDRGNRQIHPSTGATCRF
jgi:hypothetical protein